MQRKIGGRKVGDARQWYVVELPEGEKMPEFPRSWSAQQSQMIKDFLSKVYPDCSFNFTTLADLTIEVIPNSPRLYLQSKCFTYELSVCNDFAAFWRDLVTDISLSYLNQRYQLANYLPKGEGRYFISHSTNEFNYQPMLNRFWDCDALAFNTAAFLQVAQQIKTNLWQEKSSCEKVGYYASNVLGSLRLISKPTALPKLPENIALPFRDAALELKENLVNTKPRTLKQR